MVEDDSSSPDSKQKKATTFKEISIQKINPTITNEFRNSIKSILTKRSRSGNGSHLNSSNLSIFGDQVGDTLIKIIKAV